MTNTFAWPVVPKGHVYRRQHSNAMAIVIADIPHGVEVSYHHLAWKPTTPPTYPQWLMAQTDDIPVYDRVN